jgi:hypothetical protein
MEFFPGDRILRVDYEDLSGLSSGMLTVNSESDSQYSLFYAGTTAANLAKFLTGHNTKNITSR